MKKLIDLTKPFTSKSDSRPILNTALINENYIVATNAHILIRIKHNQTITEPYLHHFKEDTDNLSVSSYPQTNRLMPFPELAKETVTIDIKEWINIHSLALTAAKQHENKVSTLAQDHFSVEPLTVQTVKSQDKESRSKLTGQKGYIDIPVPEFEQISFKHTLGHSTNIEKVSYNCEYMLTALKTFKKLKETPTLYFYGPLRPMLLKSETCEILILPVRMVN